MKRPLRNVVHLTLQGADADMDIVVEHVIQLTASTDSPQTYIMHTLANIIT